MRRAYKHRIRHTIKAAAFVAALAVSTVAAPHADATLTGLNQIVTPDTMPAGQFSAAYEAQGSSFGGSDQLLFDLGVTDRLEVGLFHQLSPETEYYCAQYSLLAKPPYLLTGGFINWSNRGDDPQAYLEAGYYRGPYQLTVGVSRVGASVTTTGIGTHKSYGAVGILGLAYLAAPRMTLQADYQSGPGNSATAGFDYELTPSVSVTPSVFMSNDPGRALTGYCVLTYTFTAFTPCHSKSNAHG